MTRGALHADARAHFARGAPWPDALLPRDAYVDSAWFELERERLFARAWIPLAREQEFSEPGSSGAFEIAGRPLALVRGADGQLRALSNRCLHRCALVVRSERARATELRCPFHGFRYDLAGTLSAAPHAHTYDPPFEPRRDRLHEFECATWAGWVFARVEAGGPALDEFLGPAWCADLAPWGIGAWTLVAGGAHDVACNWKVAMEAFLESIHVDTVHRGTAYPLIDSSRTRTFELGLHSGMAIPFRAKGAYTASGPMGTAALAAGVHAPRELDDERGSANFSYFLYPGCMISLLPNHLAAFHVQPVSATTSRFRWELLAIDASGENARAWRESLRPGYEQLVREDLENLPFVQRGLADPRGPAPRLSSFERRFAHFHASLRRWLAQP